MQYLINIIDKAISFLPELLQSERLNALISVLVYPVSQNTEQLHHSFEKFSQNTLYELAHNGQVMSLEKILNERFPSGNEFAKTFIEDNEDVLQAVYLFLSTETIDEPLYLFTETEIDNEAEDAEYVHLYTIIEYLAVADFVVWVHDALYADLLENGQIPYFRATIDRRKLAGKIYAINTFN